jgi:hypothetical protein
MPIVVFTLSTDAQHRCSALLSVLTCPSHQGTTTHVQVMRPRHLITASTSQYALHPIVLLRSMPIPFDFILLLHRITIHTGLFILDLSFLLSTFLFILPIPFRFHCLIPRPTSRYLSPFSTIFSNTASLSITPPYALSFSFLSFSFMSHSYWLYHYIFILALTHPLIHPSSHWLTIVLLLFLHSSKCSSHSYWPIARLSLLYESDSIATPSRIYTYHE